MKDSYIEKLLLEANRYEEGSPSDEFRTLLNQIQEFSKSEYDVALLSIAQSLDKLDSPAGVGLLAVWFGGFVENGQNPEPYIPYLMKNFLRFGEIALENKSTQTVQGLELGLEYLGQSLVAHLGRSQKSRQLFFNDEELLDTIEEIGEFSNGGVWVYELLQKVSNTLIVIHAEKKLGVRVRYENLSNCFHLFTLLQEAIVNVMPNAQKLSEDILHIAKTGDFGNDDDFDVAWWHYSHAFCKEADILSSVFGEMSPECISYIDTEQVMLLWSPILKQRSWGCDFFRPYLEAMPPSVELLEVLTDSEVEKYLGGRS